MPTVDSRANAVSAFGAPLHQNVMDNWDRTLEELWEDDSLTGSALFYQRDIIYPSYGDVEDYVESAEALARYSERNLEEVWEYDWWEDATKRLKDYPRASYRVLGVTEFIDLVSAIVDYENPKMDVGLYHMLQSNRSLSATDYNRVNLVPPTGRITGKKITLFDLGVWWTSLRAGKTDKSITVGEIATLFSLDIRYQITPLLNESPHDLAASIIQYRTVMPKDEALLWATLSTWDSTYNVSKSKNSYVLPAWEVVEIARRIDAVEARNFTKNGVPFYAIKDFLEIGLDWAICGEYVKNGFYDVAIIKKLVDSDVDAQLALELVS